MPKAKILFNRKCRVCGDSYKSHVDKDGYCSNTCKQSAYRKRVRAAKKGKSKVDKNSDFNRHICKYCGKGFFGPTRGKPREFCSNSCRANYSKYKKWAAIAAWAETRMIEAQQAKIEVFDMGLRCVDRILNQNGLQYYHAMRAYIRIDSAKVI